MNDSQAFDADWVRDAVQTHQRALVAYAWRMTGNLDSAREIAQEAFCRLCDQDHDQRRQIAGHLKPWLLTVCRNLALDSRRKEKRMSPLTDTDLKLRPGPEPGPDQQAQMTDQLQAALRRLAELPDNQREVIRLKFQQGLSYKEIADVTGLSTGNVGYLIHTGLKTLRQQLA